MSEHVFIASLKGIRRCLRVACIVDYWCEPDPAPAGETWSFIVGLTTDTAYRVLLADLSRSEATALQNEVTRWLSQRATAAFDLDAWLKDHRKWEASKAHFDARKSVAAYRAKHGDGTVADRQAALATKRRRP
jgi:hypothetical protein